MKTNYFIVRVFVNNVLKKAFEFQIYINLNSLIHTFTFDAGHAQSEGSCRVEVLAGSTAVGEIPLQTFYQKNENVILLYLNNIKASETKFTQAINKSLEPRSVRPVNGEHFHG